MFMLAVTYLPNQHFCPGYLAKTTLVTFWPQKGVTRKSFPNVSRDLQVFDSLVGLYFMVPFADICYAVEFSR